MSSQKSSKWLIFCVANRPSKSRQIVPLKANDGQEPRHTGLSIQCGMKKGNVEGFASYWKKGASNIQSLISFYRLSSLSSLDTNETRLFSLMTFTWKKELSSWK